ncbi:MAG TPA: DUF6644 family protein [Rhodospirillales bacterium]|nr:DUF6644 family protein [Rhodospirillales bacterium]
MPADLWLLLQSSAPAAAMRGSFWLYPLVNTVHVLALLAFFSAVAAIDARLLGALRPVPVVAVLRPCRRIAVVAFAVQVASGVLLFSAEAATLVGNDVFIAKMLVVALALANVAVLESVWGRTLAELPAGAAVPTAVRLTAGLSLAGWTTVAALGRLIAYV